MDSKVTDIGTMRIGWLDAKKIPYLRSPVICPPDDPKVFTSDGHFTPVKDIELAKEMISIIEKERAKAIQ